MTADLPPSSARPLMLREAAEAPGVIARQPILNHQVNAGLLAALRDTPPAYAVTLARGSSDHASTFLKYALETALGLPVASLGPSVHTLYGARLRLRGALVMAVSQSGAGPDVVETLEMAREAGALTVALVNVEDSPLAAAAQFVVPLRCGEEQAVAATKSYLASLSALLPIIAQLGGDVALQDALDRLPAVLEQTLALEDQARELARHYRNEERLIVLSRGLHWGIGQELALKLQETGGIQAGAYSAAEFSHGPKRLLTGGVRLLGLTSADAAWPATQGAYEALRGDGAALLTLGPAQGSTLATPPSGHPLTDPLVSVLAGYLFAGHLSLHRGLDPDAPPLLSKVTRTR
ncbi:SIS domain-containing protein [Deinococcus sp. Leaf326]|uniref:SIS domain-containing protein n=1 Tax=Deinococcus sp. Leaf326 TaxID=1736338 RepID=UPI0007022F9A|nr:SIS domain-containing protein [Deinococcus sp. Leaf326]KQR01000.1 glucosamine--fructose-6-phosphate aminotransferase [Deinococcus sp. Leaf326]